MLSKQALEKKLRKKNNFNFHFKSVRSQILFIFISFFHLFYFYHFSSSFSANILSGRAFVHHMCVTSIFFFIFLVFFSLFHFFFFIFLWSKVNWEWELRDWERNLYDFFFFFIIIPCKKKKTILISLAMDLQSDWMKTKPICPLIKDIVNA